LNDYFHLVRQYTIAVLLAVFTAMLVFSLAPGAGTAAFLLGLAIVAARMIFRSRPETGAGRFKERPPRSLATAAASAGVSASAVVSRPEAETRGLPAWLRLSIAVLIEHESNVEGMLALVRR
jgi:uncharacterized membrane protein YfcA